jgi:hypothetical protein
LIEVEEDVVNGKARRRRKKSIINQTQTIKERYLGYRLLNLQLLRETHAWFICRACVARRQAGSARHRAMTCKVCKVDGAAFRSRHTFVAAACSLASWTVHAGSL